MVEKKKPSHKESQNPKAKSQKPKAEQKQKSRTNAEQNRTKAEQKQNKSRKKQKSRTNVEKKQNKSRRVFTINLIIDPSERHQCFDIYSQRVQNLTVNSQNYSLRCGCILF